MLDCVIEDGKDRSGLVTNSSPPNLALFELHRLTQGGSSSITA
jgi:hypothetical protein